VGRLSPSSAKSRKGRWLGVALRNAARDPVGIVSAFVPLGAS
jgi:hypothetical protein